MSIFDPNDEPATQMAAPSRPQPPDPDAIMSLDDAIARLRFSVKYQRQLRDLRGGLYDEEPEILLAIALATKEAREKAVFAAGAVYGGSVR